jgi:hypothetical protein
VNSADRIRDPVTKAVVAEFYPRFVPHGQVLWISGSNLRPADAALDGFAEFGLLLTPRLKYPNVVIRDRKRNWLVLVHVVKLRGQMSPERYRVLKQVFRDCRLGLVLVWAFETRRELQVLNADFPWFTSAWFADEPDHMVHFGGGCISGPTRD